MPKIFISHAHADKDLVSPFVHNILQLGGGVQDNDIFYTSERDKGIQEGKNFIDELKKHLEDAPLVIMMLSPNYFNSQFCLGELGATWVLDCAIFPIVIPDMKIKDIEGILQVTPMGMINDKEYLETLFPKLTQDNSRIIAWNRHSNEFQKLLPTLLESLPKPQIILYTKYEALQNDLENTRSQIREQQQEIERLKKLNEEISSLKDQEEVSKILSKSLFESKTESEMRFDILVEHAREALSKLPQIVGYAFYFHFNENGGINFNPFWTRQHTVEYLIDRAIENQYLIQLGAEYLPNIRDNEEIRYAQQCLNKLFNFTDKDKFSVFSKRFKDNQNYPLSDAKKQRLFWKHHLHVTFMFE